MGENWKKNVWNFFYAAVAALSIKKKTALETSYYLLYADQLDELEQVISDDSISIVLLEISENCKTIEKHIKIVEKLNKLYPGIAIIVISAIENIVQTAKLLHAGATDVFPIPLRTELLMERLIAISRSDHDCKEKNESTK